MSESLNVNLSLHVWPIFAFLLLSLLWREPGPLFEQFPPSPKDDLHQVWLKCREWFFKRISMPPPPPPLRRGCFAVVCRSVCRSIHPVSVHFLRAGCTYWNEVWYTDLSEKYLGQVLFWVRSSHFWQSYGPWTSKNSNNLPFPFIFFPLDAHTEMKFGIQIY
jgi:hypothetical protein